MASRADLSILSTVGSFIDNVNKGVRPKLQIFERASGHTAGAVENKNNIHRIFRNIRSCRKTKCYLEGSAAGDL